ncbi:MAG: sigma 54-interacting transcriptional regulator [Thermoanaerobaculia bacterium]
MKNVTASFAEKRRILQLETLYDLAVVLHANRPEKELVDDLLQRICSVLDPAAAVAVTRDDIGSSRAVASVGWGTAPPEGASLLEAGVWRELLMSGQSLVQKAGVLAGRAFGEMLVTPLGSRGIFLGYIALLDKEQRGGSTEGFTAEDRRFLESVAALGGVALESVRQMEDLVVQSERLQEENKALKGSLASRLAGQRVVAQSEGMRQVLERVERVAPRNVSVVIRGESGTGKELIAKLLHLMSGRPGALVAVNCGAIPESLLESELFGIESGVATGVTARRGKLELADGGTLFLDEIGDMEPALQVKLLRALQEREIVKVGGSQTISVDVRLVTATHRDLESLVSDGLFREDLYYRLKGVEIRLPPLRERRQDIPHFIRTFTEDFCQREKIEAPHFDAEAIGLLMKQSFPGNVRELQNLVEASVSLADRVVDAQLIGSLLGPQDEPLGPEALDLKTVERRHIARVLKIAAGNKSRAAKILGLDRRTLHRKGF